MDAVAEEREACAKLADAAAHRWGNDRDEAHNATANEIAAAIRARA